MNTVVNKAPLRWLLKAELYLLALPATIFFFFAVLAVLAALAGIFVWPGYFRQSSVIAASIYGVPSLLVYGYWLYAFWSLVLYWRDRPLREMPKRIKIGLWMGYGIFLLLAVWLLNRAINDQPLLISILFLGSLAPLIPCTHFLVLAKRVERDLSQSLGIAPAAP